MPELIDEDLEFIPSGHMRVCYREEEIAELEAYAAAPEAAQLDLKIIAAPSCTGALVSSARR